MQHTSEGLSVTDKSKAFTKHSLTTEEGLKGIGFIVNTVQKRQRRDKDKELFIS